MMRNPYVGPRAFRLGEKLPAREREERELTDLLIAERIVLLHSPSGAGKTSLIQAGLTPLLQAEHLGPRRFAPTIPLRVKTPAPPGRSVRNRYVYSVAVDLLSGRDPAELESLTLPQVLAAMTGDGTGIPVLIFDQFEEVLTLNQADRTGQQVFFDELGAVLAETPVWVLLAMREEYMGGLDRYLHNFPEHLQTRYRLDFLDTAAARVAVRAPAEEQGVTFAEDAADDLLARLSKVRVQRPGNEVAEIEAPYVVPFYLQVVCRQLWNMVARRKGKAFATIEAADVKRYGDVDRPLQAYYADAVTGVAKEFGADEGAIREWFETELITPSHVRSQTLTGPGSGHAEPREVMLALTDAYLLRSDTRAGDTWYELSHDRLIQPILDDNEAWRSLNLEGWQQRARKWREGRRDELLLRGEGLRAVQGSAVPRSLTEWEQDFLNESLKAERHQRNARRARSAAGALGVLVIVQFVVIVVLVVLLVVGD